MINNIATISDGYKLSHHKVYPKGLTKLYSYLEARAPSEFSKETVVFGFQYIIKNFLGGRVISIQDLPRIRAFCKHYFMGNDEIFNEAGWRYIIEKHEGRLPVSIKAVPEGTVVPVSNVLMTIENTDPECAWLVNFLETILVQAWYPISVASLSYSIKQTILGYMKDTVDDAMIPILMPSRLHDFGFRGVSSYESAAIGGAAHLINFAGTDTLAAIDLISQYYPSSPDLFTEIDCRDCLDEATQGEDYGRSFKMWDDFYSKNMPGVSIPATEHSIMTLGGPEGEAEMCRRFLTEFPSGIIACVSDSYDLFNCVNEIWGTQLKDQIMKRDGILVIRPDSGEPVDIVCRTIEALGQKFGYTTNSKGYKELDSHVRIIQGDGVNWKTIRDILEALKKAGWAASNIAFGSGGALLQKLHRDTFAFAFKVSYAEIGGVARDVYKAPKTDSSKASKRGRLKLCRTGWTNTLETFSENTVSSDTLGGDILREVFRDGELLIDDSFETIRARAEVK
jgi:nicotinamide phosphoribosyltransferase